jgi:polysaccharide biosynthesis transport protein
MKEQIENALAIRPPEPIVEAPQTQFVPVFQPEVIDDGVRLQDYLRSVRKRLWMVLGIAVLVTTLTTVLMLRQPNIYEAEARVQVDLENTAPAFGASKNGSIMVNNSANDPAYFNTQLQILAGPNLLRRAVKTLDLEHNPSFLSSVNRKSLWKNLERMVGLGGREQSDARNTGDIPLVNSSRRATMREDLEEANRLAPYVNALQRTLKIEPVKESRLLVKDTRLIEISFSNADPQLAARVVNIVADTFALANLEKKSRTSSASGDFLQKRIAELQSQIRHGEEKLISYAKSNQILSLDNSQNTVVDRLTGLNKQLLEAENERKLNEAAYGAAQAPGAAGALAEENAKAISDAEQKLSELRQRRAQLLVDNTEEWPEVKEVDRQITVSEKEISNMRSRATSILLTNLRTRYRQSLQREQALRRAFEHQRGETLTQNEAAINYRIIQQEIETSKDLLEGLLQRSKENDVMLAGTPNNVSVADYAVTPREAAGPQRLLAVVLAFVLSLTFGAGLAMLLEYLDDTVRSSADVERTLHLAALAVIPAVGGLARHRFLPLTAARQTHHSNGADRPALLINPESQPAIAEAFKQLRTSMLLSTAGGAPKKLLVTSGQSGEGKTTTVVNTAISLAQTEAKVLIIDADMRQPTIHSIFKLTNVVGLSEVLSKDASEADILSLVQFHQDSGLYIMTSGAIPPNPAELLGSKQMSHLLKTLEQYFDYIVIDSPPVVSITDGVLLSSMVDGVILVVHGGRSTRDLVRRACQLLRGVGARVFGVVLNNVDVDHHDYYYQGHYRKLNATAEAKRSDLISVAD